MCLGMLNEVYFDILWFCGYHSYERGTILQCFNEREAILMKSREPIHFRHWMMKIISVITSLWLISGLTVMASDVITIKIDDVTLVFTENYGMPYIDDYNRTQVPVRQVLETYGATVNWNGVDRIVEVTYQSILLEIPIGRSEIIRNGENIPIDTAALIKDGRTYLPIRSVIEALGGLVDWDSEDQAVLLRHQGMVIEATSSSHYELGLSKGEIIIHYGEPDVVVASNYGFDWWIYRNSYEDYIQLGVYDNILEAIYITKEDEAWPYKVNIGMTLEDVNDYGITRSRNSWIGYGNIKLSDDSSSATDGDVVLWPFIDDFDHNRIYGLIAIRADYNTRWSNGTSSNIESSYEQQIVELTNVFRVANGLSPLVIESELSKVAKAHSEDMEAQGYFSHTNQQGESPFDRMSDSGIDYVMAGENIAMGQTSAINVMDAWLNSEGHRSNMLLDFKSVGVGVSEGLYYTQDFITAP